MEGNPFTGTKFEQDWLDGLNAGMVAPQAEISAPSPMMGIPGNPNTIGASRRWQVDCAVKCSASSTEIDCIRSEAEGGGHTRGWGCGARGGSPLPRLNTQNPGARSALRASAATFR